MTITDEILISANQLANAGKKPTVALIKSKLTQKAPLTVIITTLKNWQHQPDFIQQTIEIKNKEKQVTTNNDTSTLLDSLRDSKTVKKLIKESLDQELTEMKSELSEMKSLINKLNDQLKQIT